MLIQPGFNYMYVSVLGNSEFYGLQLVQVISFGGNSYPYTKDDYLLVKSEDIHGADIDGAEEGFVKVSDVVSRYILEPEDGVLSFNYADASYGG